MDSGRSGDVAIITIETSSQVAARGGGRMMLNRTTRVAYGLLGILYVCLGVGSMLLPIGWLPGGVADKLLAGETLNPFVEHLLQEFGTVVLALGLVFVWAASRKEYSGMFHWAMTFYFS